MVYTPQEIACKTVIVTEPSVSDIVATVLTIQSSVHEAPCTIDMYIKWENFGTAAGTFKRGYLINGTLHEEANTQTIQPDRSTYQLFSHAVDTAGTYTLCPVLDPVPSLCKDVTVTKVEVADIVATNITVTPPTCEAPCSVSISITWENVGTATGSFYPGYDIDGAPVTESSAVTLGPGNTLSRVYTETLPDAGSYVICPVPN